VNYRPQFAAPPTPPGFHDEEFTHYFDGLSNPALNLTLGTGAVLRDVQLQLETDAVFIAQGIRYGGFSLTNVQLREPGGRYLSQAFVSPFQSYVSGGLAVFPAGTLELMTVPLEPEIECPAGSVFLAYFENPTAAPLAIGGVIALMGVK